LNAMKKICVVLVMVQFDVDKIAKTDEVVSV
jgi:hypothetical protein